MKDNNKGTFAVVIAVVVGILLLLYFRKKKPNVTTSITYDNKPVVKVTLQDLMPRMYQNEFINNEGKLCSTTLGKTFCFAGNPIDVLATRS